ncbi:hypothetical protein GCM10027456_32350 [Kineosporia babensis]
MGIGFQVARADPVQQVAERGVAGGAGPQDEGVQEAADQVLQRRVGAAGRDRADRDVGARAKAGEQRGEGGVQRHEDRGAVPAGGPAEFVLQPGRQVQVNGAGRRTAVRARTVGGQGDLVRKVLKALAPVAQFVAGSQVFGVPEGIVGVPHGQRRPRRCETGAALGVGVGEVGGQRA